MSRTRRSKQDVEGAFKKWAARVSADKDKPLSLRVPTASPSVQHGGGSVASSDEKPEDQAAYTSSKEQDYQGG
jgi:hypothetical protein